MRRKDLRGSIYDWAIGERRESTLEEKDVATKIRRGILPVYHLQRQGNGSDQLERKPRQKLRTGVNYPKLTWRQQSSFAILTKKDKMK